MKLVSLRGRRAISPIFATLILIAIAVVGGVVVYLYTSGYLSSMTGGGGVGQEKVAIQTVNVGANGLITVYCKNIGGGDVIVTDAILKNSAGDSIQVLTLTTSVTLPSSGTMTAVACQFTAGNVVVGNTYTVTLVSAEGTPFVSSSFQA